MTQTSNLTGSGEVMGTPAYMAPEQAQGRKNLIGEATDVHGLGIILYEMLTGQSPYGNDSPAEVLVRLLKEEPPRPRLLDRRVPQDLETICLKALAKAPEGRYPTVRAFLEDIHRFESGRPIQARRPGWRDHAGRLLRRYGKSAAAITCVAALLILLGPRLLDKTVDQLIAVADEQHSAGQTSAALHVYRRALDKARGEQRRQVLHKLLGCCEELGDDRSALDACRFVLQTEPDVSFGTYDYLVARDAVERVRSEDKGEDSRFIKDRYVALLKSAQKRLEVFLHGAPAWGARQREASYQLVNVRQALEHNPYAAETWVNRRLEMPDGTPEELRERAQDNHLSAWEQGKAAYAAGLALEGSGAKQAALTAFRQASHKICSVYPVFTGATWLSLEVADRTVTAERQAAECLLVRDVLEAVHRLDRASTDTLRGGLQFRVEGVEIPDNILIFMHVTLTDPALQPADEKVMDARLCRTIPLQADQTARIGVADGRYRITVRKNGWKFTSQSALPFCKRLELDAAAPAEVEIHGEWKDVSIRARLVP